MQTRAVTGKGQAVRGSRPVIVHAQRAGKSALVALCVLPRRLHKPRYQLAQCRVVVPRLPRVKPLPAARREARRLRRPVRPPSRLVADECGRTRRDASDAGHALHRRGQSLLLCIGIRAVQGDVVEDDLGHEFELRCKDIEALRAFQHAITEQAHVRFRVGKEVHPLGLASCRLVPRHLADGGVDAAGPHRRSFCLHPALAPRRQPRVTAVLLRRLAIACPFADFEQSHRAQERLDLTRRELLAPLCATRQAADGLALGLVPQLRMQPGDVHAEVEHHVQLAGAALGLQARARVPGAPTKHTRTRCQ